MAQDGFLTVPSETVYVNNLNEQVKLTGTDLLSHASLQIAGSLARLFLLLYTQTDLNCFPRMPPFRTNPQCSKKRFATCLETMALCWTS